MRKPRPPVEPAAIPEKPRPVPKSHLDLWICLALLFATFALYAPVRHFDFVNFDDPDYVTGNPHVRQGITLPGIAWAFTSGDAANWFPVTRFSHMLDYQLFGAQAGWHHLMNVLWHALAALLLFAFLQRATRARWPSAFVAFVFALHPLHVESVAWVAERKDVLCAFFWFLALWGYARYAERPTRGRYLLVLAAFCLGLMSKPMIVTLPFLLLLLDVWPLRRWNGARSVREKLPFFALSAAAAIVTLVVQQGSGAVRGIAAFPLGLRLGNALISYVWYIARMFWPARLAVFYPYPHAVALWEAGLALLVLAGISLAVARTFRERPYLAVGWLWFLITLLPVTGIIQVGAQARADRYMYVPMTGLAILLAWGAARVRPQAAAILALVACAVCVPVTWAQLQHWRNSETLFQHALSVTDGNYLAHHNLGNALLDAPGRLPEATEHLEAALRIQPDSLTAHTDLGIALSKTPGRAAQAVDEYRSAIAISPDAAIPHNDLASALAKAGRLPEAIAEYETALRLQPDYADAHNNLGSALAKAGRTPEAIAQFQTALRLQPDDVKTHLNFGSALAETPGRLNDAIAEYEEAVRLRPDSPEAQNNLASVLLQAPGRLTEAIAHSEAALRLRPDYAEAHLNLGSALADVPGRLQEAMSHYETALRLEPESPEIHYNLGLAFAKNGRQSEAIAQLETALRLRPDYAEAHNNLGALLSENRGRPQDAIAHFQTALRLKPDYADAHYNLGVALSGMPGRQAEALSQLEEALRLKPDPELRQTVDRMRSGKR